MSKIQIIDPTAHPNWDDLLLSAPGASFFHTTAWASVLREAYGYAPLYFAIVSDGRLEGLIPVMQIDSFLTGRRGVALPFTDFCSPIGGRRPFRELWEHVVEYGRAKGWQSIELRGGGSCWTPSRHSPPTSFTGSTSRRIPRLSAVVSDPAPGATSARPNRRESLSSCFTPATPWTRSIV